MSFSIKDLQKLKLSLERMKSDSMGKKCHICGKQTIFFIWSSSAAFPLEKLKLNKLERKIYRIGVPICFSCFNKIKEVVYGNQHRETSKDNIRTKNK